MTWWIRRFPVAPRDSASATASIIACIASLHHYFTTIYHFFAIRGHLLHTIVWYSVFLCKDRKYGSFTVRPSVRRAAKPQRVAAGAGIINDRSFPWNNNVWIQGSHYFSLGQSRVHELRNTAYVIVFCVLKYRRVVSILHSVRFALILSLIDQ